MSAMDTSDGPAAEEKKDDPPPPRFEIKKWNAVRSLRPPTTESRATVRRKTRPAPPTQHAIDAGLHVVLGHLRRHLRYL